MVDLRGKPEDELKVGRSRRIGAVELLHLPLDLESIECTCGRRDHFLRHDLRQAHPLHIYPTLRVPLRKLDSPTFPYSERQANAVSVVRLKSQGSVCRPVPIMIKDH